MEERRAVSRPSLLGLGLLLLLLSPEAGAQEETASLNPLHALPKDGLRGFRERPLFSPTRTEPQAAPREAAAPATAMPSEEPPPDFRLVGIVSGAETLAVIRVGSDAKTTTVATGDTVGAWTVTVLPDGVRLVAGTRTVAVDLFTPKSAPPASGPPPASPAGNPLAAPDDHPP
jgi:hypothetical protein